MKKERVVNIKYAQGKGDYERVIKSIEATGQCPFCPDNFTYHRKKSLKRSGEWFITNNTWPYPNSRIHLLLIGDKHKEEFKELTANDFKSVSNLASWAIKKYKIKGGALTMRFGDTEYTGATVCHIHFHIISPKRKNGKTQHVSFPVG